jgi:hypothetical protein
LQRTLAFTHGTLRTSGKNNISSNKLDFITENPVFSIDFITIFFIFALTLLQKANELLKCLKGKKKQIFMNGKKNQIVNH